MPTRFRSTFYTYAAIQDVTDDYITDTTYINIRNPYNRPYTVELDPATACFPSQEAVSIPWADSLWMWMSRTRSRSAPGRYADGEGPEHFRIYSRYFRLERRTEKYGPGGHHGRGRLL